MKITGAAALEIGDLELPLPMNHGYVWDNEETFMRRVFRPARRIHPDHRTSPQSGPGNPEAGVHPERPLQPSLRFHARRHRLDVEKGSAPHADPGPGNSEGAGGTRS